MITIPNFPEQTTIQLSHRDALTEAITAQGIKSAEFSLYYLLSWFYTRPAYISRIDNRLILDVESREGCHIFLGPFGTGPIKPAVEKMLTHMESLGCERAIRYIPQTLVDEIKTVMNPIKEVEHRDYFDYIYSREELAELPGRKFQKRRNQVNRIQRTINPKIKIISKDDVEEIMHCLDLWYEKYGDGDLFLEMEKESVKRALPMLWTLGGVGVKLEMEEGMCGLSWAIPVTKETWLVPVEKASREVGGMYQYVNWALANNLPPEVKFLNREADLGIEGLRIAKTRYNPVEFEKKYSLWF
jgi:hypothetical protein